MPEPILSLVDVHAGYDGVPVVFGVSLEVMPGELVAVVGANGAGKSTTMRTIAGLNNPLQGSIRFEGRDISRLRPHQTLTVFLAIPADRQQLPDVLRGVPGHCHQPAMRQGRGLG